MKIALTLTALLSLQGCVEYESSPAAVKMSEMCQSGNLQACSEVVDYEQQVQEQYAASIQNTYTPIYVDPNTFDQPVPQRVQYKFNCDNLNTPYIVEACYGQ